METKTRKLNNSTVYLSNQGGMIIRKIWRRGFSPRQSPHLLLKQPPNHCCQPGSFPNHNQHHHPHIHSPSPHHNHSLNNQYPCHPPPNPYTTAQLQLPCQRQQNTTNVKEHYKTTEKEHTTELVHLTCVATVTNQRRKTLATADTSAKMALTPFALLWKGSNTQIRKRGWRPERSSTRPKQKTNKKTTKQTTCLLCFHLEQIILHSWIMNLPSLCYSN